MRHYSFRPVSVAIHVLTLELLLCACVAAEPQETPTPVGTWSTIVRGTVFVEADEQSRPLDGATVRYDVLHSYFPELQADRPNVAATDSYGEFSLPVVVHDTDRIRIVVEARGCTPYEVQLNGVELVAGAGLEIGLSCVPSDTLGLP